MSPESPQDTNAAAALRLPQELTIYAVGELHPQWLAWLATAAGREEAEVDANEVDQVDAAGLQLLVALERSLADRGVRLRINEPSAALRQGCGVLGLVDWLAGSGHAAKAAQPTQAGAAA